MGDNGSPERLAWWNTRPESSEPRTACAQLADWPLSIKPAWDLSSIIHWWWFSRLKMMQPGNAKGSQKVPALSAYHNTPGSTNFRFSSAVTAKLQHQLNHNQWRISVFIDCMLGSQGESCTAFHLSVITGWGMASGEVVLGIQLF